MLKIGVVTFGYENKRESKKLAQRIITIGRQNERYTYPIRFYKIEASDYFQSKNETNQKKQEKWKELIESYEGFIFLVPKDTTTIEDYIRTAVNNSEDAFKNKALLMIRYGADNKFGNPFDLRKFMHSKEMVVLYHTVDVPFSMDSNKTSLQEMIHVEDQIAAEIEKLLYWTRGSKYTRTLLEVLE